MAHPVIQGRVALVAEEGLVYLVKAGFHLMDVLNASKKDLFDVIVFLFDVASSLDLVGSSIDPWSTVKNDWSLVNMEAC